MPMFLKDEEFYYKMVNHSYLIVGQSSGIALENFLFTQVKNRFKENCPLENYSTENCPLGKLLTIFIIKNRFPIVFIHAET